MSVRLVAQDLLARGELAVALELGGREQARELVALAGHVGAHLLVEARAGDRAGGEGVDEALALLRLGLEDRHEPRLLRVGQADLLAHDAQLDVALASEAAPPPLA